MKMSKWFEHKGTLYNLDKFYRIVDSCNTGTIHLMSEINLHSKTLYFESHLEANKSLDKIRKLLLQTQEKEIAQSRCY